MVTIADTTSTRIPVLGAGPTGPEHAVRTLLNALQLEFKACRDDFGGRAFAAYGVHTIDKDNAWALRVVAGHGRDPGSVAFEIATLFKVCAEDWYLVPELAIHDKKIAHIQRWVAKADDVSSHAATLNRDYLGAVQWTFDRNRGIRAGILAAEDEMRTLQRQLKADAGGNLTIAGATGVCRIVADGDHAAAEFRVKVRDPAKIEAILAILNGAVPSPTPTRRRPSV